MEAVRTFMRVKRGMQCDTGFQQVFFLILNDFFLYLQSVTSSVKGSTNLKINVRKFITVCAYCFINYFKNIFAQLQQ